VDTRIHDALHSIMELQKSLDRLKRIFDELVKEDKDE